MRYLNKFSTRPGTEYLCNGKSVSTKWQVNEDSGDHSIFTAPAIDCAAGLHPLFARAWLALELVLVRLETSLTTKEADLTQ